MPEPWVNAVYVHRLSKGRITRALARLKIGESFTEGVVANFSVAVTSIDRSAHTATLSFVSCAQAPPAVLLRSVVLVEVSTTSPFPFHRDQPAPSPQAVLHLSPRLRPNLNLNERMLKFSESLALAGPQWFAVGSA